MTVAAGQPAGQNPAYRPADRPTGFSAVNHQVVEGRRRGRSLSAAQLGLLALAFVVFGFPTRGHSASTALAGRPGTPDPNTHVRHQCFGLPVATTVVPTWNERYKVDSWQVKFFSPFLPLSALVFAVRVPLALRDLASADPLALRPWSVASAYAAAGGLVAGLPRSWCRTRH